MVLVICSRNLNSCVQAITPNHARAVLRRRQKNGAYGRPRDENDDNRGDSQPLYQRSTTAPSKEAGTSSEDDGPSDRSFPSGGLGFFCAQSSHWQHLLCLASWQRLQL